MAWLVLDLTGSGAALGTLLMAASLPSIVLAPISGVLADTLNRKKIVVSMDIIRFPKQQKTSVSSAPRGDFVKNLKGGFLYLWENSGLRVLIACGVILNFLFNPLFGVVFPFFGKEVLSMTPEYYGFSQSSFPLGMLLGTMLVAFLAQKFTKISILTGGATLQGLSVLALGLLALPVVYPQLSSLGILSAMLAPLLVMGIISVQVNVQVNVMMQETVPDNYRGRVFALFGSLMQIAAPLGMGFFGILLDVIPVHFFFLFSGSIAVLVAMVLGTSPSLRRLVQPEQAPGADERTLLDEHPKVQQAAAVSEAHSAPANS